MIEAVAAGLGHLARLVLLTLRFAIYVSGPLLVIYGAYLIYPPAAFIVTGLFAMWAIREPRMPSKDGVNEPA